MALLAAHFHAFAHITGTPVSDIGPLALALTWLLTLPPQSTLTSEAALQASWAVILRAFDCSIGLVGRAWWWLFLCKGLMTTSTP